MEADSAARDIASFTVYYAALYRFWPYFSSVHTHTESVIHRKRGRGRKNIRVSQTKSICLIHTPKEIRFYTDMLMDTEERKKREKREKKDRRGKKKLQQRWRQKTRVG